MVGRKSMLQNNARVFHWIIIMCVCFVCVCIHVCYEFITYKAKVQLFNCIKTICFVIFVYVEYQIGRLKLMFLKGI